MYDPSAFQQTILDFRNERVWMSAIGATTFSREGEVSAEKCRRTEELPI
jgi:hypothetical protein